MEIQRYAINVVLGYSWVMETDFFAIGSVPCGVKLAAVPVGGSGAILRCTVY